MLARDTMVSTGNFLFRWRGQLPLLALPFFALAASQGEPLEQLYGERGEVVIETLAFLLIFGGLVLRALCVGHAPRGTSGRNRIAQVAEVLNTTGLYSQCRNPLYLANCMTYVGLAVYAQSVPLALTLCLILALYYERIILAEEAFLEEKFGRDYVGWAANVPAFFPKFRHWSKPACSYSWRSVFRREYPGWLSTLILLAGIDLGHELVEGASLREDWIEWSLIMALVVLCVLLRVLKKHTDLLVHEGR